MIKLIYANLLLILFCNLTANADMVSFRFENPDPDHYVILHSCGLPSDNGCESDNVWGQIPGVTINDAANQFGGFNSYKFLYLTFQSSTYWKTIYYYKIPSDGSTTFNSANVVCGITVAWNTFNDTAADIPNPPPSSGSKTGIPLCKEATNNPNFDHGQNITVYIAPPGSLPLFDDYNPS